MHENQKLLLCLVLLACGALAAFPPQKYKDSPADAGHRFVLESRRHDRTTDWNELALRIFLAAAPGAALVVFAGVTSSRATPAPGPSASRRSSVASAPP